MECSYNPHGCIAFLLIEPGSWALDTGWTAGYEDPQFPEEAAGIGLENVSGSVLGAPTWLVPGDYRLGVVNGTISDLPSPGFSQLPIMRSQLFCSTDLTVEPSTREVTVRVTFRTLSCEISESKS